MRWVVMIIDVDMIIDWKEKNRVFRSIWNESRMNNVIEIELMRWSYVIWDSSLILVTVMISDVMIS